MSNTRTEKEPRGTMEKASHETIRSPLPRDRGVYLAFLELEGTVTHPRVRRVINPGLYIYVGSAGGRGGLRARLLRHASRSKKPYWHLDWLTVEPRVFLKGSCWCRGKWGRWVETSLSSCISAKFPGAGVEGFGASDDPWSPTHFYKVAESWDEFVEKGFREALDCLMVVCEGLEGVGCLLRER